VTDELERIWQGVVVWTWRSVSSSVAWSCWGK